MNDRITAMINGANARLLSRFTSKDAHQEVSARTRSYDLVDATKKRRLIWLGHILRMQGPRLVKPTTKIQHDQKLAGDLFTDLPDYLHYDEIVLLAQNRKN